VRTADTRQFADYQKLVNHIRGAADTDITVLKDENEQPKKHVADLEADLTEQHQSMELKDAIVGQLEESLKTTSDKANDERSLQTLRIDSLEVELKELREFKEKVKGLF